MDLLHRKALHKGRRLAPLRRFRPHQISDLRVKKMRAERCAQLGKRPGPDHRRVRFVQKIAGSQRAYRWLAAGSVQRVPTLAVVDCRPPSTSPGQGTKPEGRLFARPLVADEFHPATRRNLVVGHAGRHLYPQSRNARLQGQQHRQRRNHLRQPKEPPPLCPPGRVGKSSTGRGEPARGHLCRPVRQTKSHPIRQPQRGGVGLGKAQAHRVGLVGDDRAMAGQCQRIAPDAAAQIQKWAGGRAALNPFRPSLGNRPGRGLLQGFRREEEPIRSREFACGPTAQCGLSQQRSGLLRREGFAQIAQQRQVIFRGQITTGQPRQGCCPRRGEQKIYRRCALSVLALHHSPFAESHWIPDTL